MGCAGGLTGCHAPGGSPTLGRLANEMDTCERREDCQLGLTAGKGPIAPGRSRAQNQQVQVPDDRDHRCVVKTSQSEEKCLKPRSRPGDHSSIASSSEDLDIPIAQEHVATLLYDAGELM
jgi:hypothetical protein